MKYYVGIDLGGTNVRVCKINEEGKILQDIISPSYGMEGPDRITGNIIDLLKKFDLSDVEGIGVGIPGPVDAVTNTITIATNIPGCAGYPFADKIAEATGKKVVLDNDANVAGLAEAIFGAGKGYPVVYYITHSTGIGGGLVVNGKVVQGHKGYGGEIANVIVDPTGPRFDRYSHLNVGAVESLASGTAIGLIGKEKLGDKVNSGRDVFDLASKGDPTAIEIIDKASKDIATMMSAISAVVAPDIFVIGGGCSHSSDVYFDRIRKYFKTMCHEGMKEVPIVKAKLEEPGVLGAAMTVKSAEN